MFYYHLGRKTAKTLPILSVHHPETKVVTSEPNIVRNVVRAYCQKVATCPEDLAQQAAPTLLPSKTVPLTTDPNEWDFLNFEKDCSAIQESETHFTIQGMHNHKSPGPDRIVARVYKAFSNPLITLYTKFLTQCTRFGPPTNWLKSNISGIHKSGSPSDEKIIDPLP